MKKLFPLSLALIFILACRRGEQIPNDVLSKEKMQAVMWDVMRADQFLSAYVLSKDSSLDKVTESLKYYQDIFTLHQVTREQFQKSFSFYKDHPQLFKTIMDSMSQSRAEAPTSQIAAPTVTVQPIPAPDTTRVLQKPKRDTTKILRNKKGLILQ